MRGGRPAAVLGTCLALLVGCERRPPVLATVGDRSITAERFGAALEAQTGKAAAEVSPDLAAALFEDFLIEELVLVASGSTSDRSLSGVARSARVRELLVSLCPPPPPPSEADVDGWLARHGQATATTERIRLRQLILPDQATARMARERARQGEPFESLSRELSRAPNASTGGLIGWVERGQLPPEFEAAVFGLAPAAYSEPVASNAGWHVFQVMERRAAGAATDPSVRERARAEIGAELAESQRRSCLHELAARVGVKTECREATFPCRNPFEGGQP